jgi:TonB family protein
VWAAGALVVAARYVRGAMCVSRMIARSTPSSAALLAGEIAASLGVRRAVRVRIGADAAVPMAWGVLRPAVLLPESSREWPAARLRSVLLHELTHVARFDPATQALAHAACCLYWLHPLAWLAARRLREERERACDDAVLRHGVEPVEYAGHLLDLARAVPGVASLAPAMAESSDLEGRVRALLDRGRNRRPVGRLAAALTLGVALAALIPLAAFRAQAQPPRGAIAGVVKDASGAVVPGCSVTARNLTGSNQEVATADQVGEFHFAAIPAGRYSLEFRSRGFKMLVRQTPLEAGQVARADVTLEIGAVAENMVITGKGPASPPPVARAGAPQRIRVGGNVQATKLLKMVRPSYPAHLQQLGVEGVVLLRAVISTEGSLLNLEVANSGVDPELAKAALDAVREWRYQPTLLNGQPVEVATTVTVEFRLER